MRIVFLFLFCINASCLFAQGNDTIPLKFIPAYGKEILHLQDSSFYSNDKDSIEISALKFYISDVELYNEGNLVWKEKGSYHLIDASEEKTLIVPLSVPKISDFDSIVFDLGIDSVTNVTGVQGGDLDPMKGMYWTWQSGYINFKLEGKSPLCNTRHHAFEFHIGGYHYPYNTLQRISQPTNKSNRGIVVFILLKSLLSTFNLAKTNQIMTPGKEALWISEEVKKNFSTLLFKE